MAAARRGCQRRDQGARRPGHAPALRATIARMSSLFADADAERRLTPLAERMRPCALGEVAGQPEAVEVLRELTSRARLPSLILWGPPGCGKTTIARLLAGDKYYFEPMSAALAGVKDVRAAV